MGRKYNFAFMKGIKKRWIVWVSLAVIIRVISFFPEAVEKYYSTGLYPVISLGLRFLFGWIPFSAGDLLYAAAVIYLLVKIFRFFKTVIRKKADRLYWKACFYQLAATILIIYVIFNLFWGLNYNRVGMAAQMHLQMKPYTTEELQQVMTIVVKRLDSTNVKALQTRNVYLQKQALFKEAYHSYQLAKPQYNHLSYSIKSVKPSLFSYLGDYMGYSGYYNPFTGEAQVNTTVPVFIQPFTTCHEVGHQLGYAKENEANFAGYLSGKSSADAAFTYSVYFDLYNYGMPELFGRDSMLAKELIKQKPLQVKKDILTLRKFYAGYENPIEPYIRRLYGQYLRANQQPSGMESYNEVMAFLIAYYKKYGGDAL